MMARVRYIYIYVVYLSCHFVTRIIKKIFIGKLGKVLSFMIVPGNSTDSQ